MFHTHQGDLYAFPFGQIIIIYLSYVLNTAVEHFFLGECCFWPPVALIPAAVLNSWQNDVGSLATEFNWNLANF